MPTYEYTCRACGEDLEAVQQFSDDPLTVCPTCGGELRKVFRSVGIVFKGSGFYKNDSRSSSTSTKPATSETPTGESSTATSTETKSTESKPATAPATPASTSTSSSTPAVPAS